MNHEAGTQRRGHRTGPARSRLELTRVLSYVSTIDLESV